MEIDEKTKTQRRNTVIWIVVLSVVVLALAGLLYWQIRNLNASKKLANATPTATATVTQTATKTATKTSTATVTSTAEDRTPQVRTASDGFLGAYVGRNLADAKPFMTDGFFASWTQEGFAGVSSPGRLNFEVVDISTGAGPWQVLAKVNLQLNGEDAGYESWRLDVDLVDGKYLVSAMNAASL